MDEKVKQNLMVVSIAGVVIFGILAYSYFMFIKGNIETMERAISTSETNIRNYRSEIQKFERLINEDEDKRQAREVVVAQIAERLPRTSDPIEFTDLIRESMSRANVASTFLDPGTTASYNQYTEIKYQIRGVARYHDFGQFVNLIECHPRRFMRVTGFKLTNSASRPSYHPVEIGLATFTFRGN